MRVLILKLYMTLFLLTIYISVFSQENIKKANSNDNAIDSLKRMEGVAPNTQKTSEIVFSTSQALKFLQQIFNPELLKNKGDSLMSAVGRLIYEVSHPPLDSLRNMLEKYPYDSVKFRITRVKRSDSEMKDTTAKVINDTLNEAPPVQSVNSFGYLNYPIQGDSIKAAVRSLLKYLEYRDSTVINFTGLGKSVTPIKMNSKSESVIRYWLKNEFADSVTIWIANPTRNTLGLYLEQGVTFRRPAKQGNYANARVNTQALDNSKLLVLRNLKLRPVYWKYHNEASFVLNQASLSNWVKGGESSIATAMDVTEYAEYNNKALKLSSDNFARLKFGYIETGQDGIRKNIDLLETNSKFNHKAFGKFDFSAILLFKTQIALGRNYFKTTSGKDTSNLVSKFMNPATITIGLGLDYQPNKSTSINFSPFSYKGTFVTDTVHIDQTQYGIAKNRKSLNEPGISFMITNEFKPIETVTIVNRLQLFTNYIHNPQNVDVDWEMIATAKLNWFTDVRFNTHLVYDDDTKTEEQYANGQPVLNPDGTKKKSARIQFKEMLGLSLFLRF
jgi:hypothetical protein